MLGFVLPFGKSKGKKKKKKVEMARLSGNYRLCLSGNALNSTNNLI